MNLEHPRRFERARGLNEDHFAVEKEIKVRIPLPYHIKLHTIKVLHGQSISTTVKEALEEYFVRFEAEKAHGAEQRLAAWAPEDPSTPG